MSIGSWFRTPRVRRGLAAASVVLAAGALVLWRAPASARPAVVLAQPAGQNVSAFSGPGAKGSLSLSHTKLLARGEQRLYAELRLVADAAERVRVRAPLSIAVVLDTSGSMGGEKIEQAKDSVAKLLRDMRDDDEIALVRYATDSEIVQPLARVGAVRAALIQKVLAIQAGGGTNIPPALARGLDALRTASSGRVKRVVLVSDGLDSTRTESERIARDAAERLVTVSSLGIGLDFDEAYMGGVAIAGHGNFGFVRDAAALATFLRRELEETAATTVENAAARIRLPEGVRFVRALGADARPTLDGREVELRMGSLFAGDERHVVIELAASPEAGETLAFDGQVLWNRVGGDTAKVLLSRIEVTATADEREAAAGRDGTVIASATSVIASARQLEATEAWARGDAQRAQALVDRNMADLREAAAIAPAPAAASLSQQVQAYEGARRSLASAPPGSAASKAAAKAMAERDLANMKKRSY